MIMMSNSKVRKLVLQRSSKHPGTVECFLNRKSLAAKCLEIMRVLPKCGIEARYVLGNSLLDVCT